VQGRCVRRTRANRRHHQCPRRLPAGTLTVSEPAGAATISFNGHVTGSTLAPGSYTATVTARTPGGSGSPVQVGALSFTVVK
jgi:hypothetical protein